MTPDLTGSSCPLKNLNLEGVPVLLLQSLFCFFNPSASITAKIIYFYWMLAFWYCYMQQVPHRIPSPLNSSRQKHSFWSQCLFQQKHFKMPQNWSLLYSLSLLPPGKRRPRSRLEWWIRGDTFEQIFCISFTQQPAPLAVASKQECLSLGHWDHRR